MFLIILEKIINKRNKSRYMNNNNNKNSNNLTNKIFQIKATN